MRLQCILLIYECIMNITTASLFMNNYIDVYKGE